LINKAILYLRQHQKNIGLSAFYKTIFRFRV
jgi:hypothetical protein